MSRKSKQIDKKKQNTIDIDKKALEELRKRWYIF
ncbi:Uncharacterised protein [Streptococcus hyointestinalis]|uniref:Uncharacterized protein n=1 Tax=Streptococcus hyointestinalis TaxID=1337 RepID=A0A380KEC4_9STRE|nr:Uncharacterised protein [Streptococcus hyointestinalis]